MVRCVDRPLLQVQISFEATRLGPRHLIAAYASLVPTIRRTTSRSKRDNAGTLPPKRATAAAGGET